MNKSPVNIDYHLLNVHSQNQAMNIYIYICVCVCVCVHVCNVHAKVTAFAIYTPLMMAEDQAESPSEPINHRRFINQFLPDIIKLMWRLERINIKICRQRMSILFYRIYIYIYIYIYTHTHTYIYICMYIFDPLNRIANVE